jgi:hypothetical protein
MKHKKYFVYIRIVSLLFLIIGAILSTIYTEEKILSIQLYTALDIPTLFYLFGGFMFIVSYANTEIGFFKFVIILGIVSITLAGILYISSNRTRYMLLENEDHRIIIQHTINEANTDYKFYKKDSGLFYIQFARNPKKITYETTITIDGDHIVLEKCSENFCYTDYVDLD